MVKAKKQTWNAKHIIKPAYVKHDKTKARQNCSRTPAFPTTANTQLTLEKIPGKSCHFR